MSGTGEPADARAVETLRRPAAQLRRHLAPSPGAALGLLVVGGVTVADVLVGGRSVPLTAVLLGPLTAGALTAPAGVVAVGAAAVGAAAGLALHEGLAGVEAWARVLLVLAAAAGSVAFAAVRTRHERALEQAGRAARLSEALQQGLLPTLYGTADVAVRAVYRPSAHDLFLGGDFIDVVPAPYAGEGAVAFCVGDVTGHDAAAASLGASLRAAWRGLALTGGDPASWLRSLDEMVRLEAREDDKLATVLVGILEPARRRVQVASAGHPRPVLLSDRATLVDVEAGPPLGLPSGLGGDWDGDVLGLGTRFSLVLYTDGLVEGRRAPGSSSRYGEESLAAWLDSETVDGQVGDGALDRLLCDVEAANGGPLHDDVAMVVLSDTGPSAALAALLPAQHVPAGA